MNLMITVQYNLKEVGDIERIISKVATARINPKEVVQLKRALTAIEPIKAACKATKSSPLKLLADQLNPCDALRLRIEKEIVDEPAIAIGKGQIISEGLNADLDEYRSLRYSGKEYLENLKIREIERTGIPSLKIDFNNVFGYYIEVRNTHKDKVPEEWIRKQTLVNAERYTSLKN